MLWTLVFIILTSAGPQFSTMIYKAKLFRYLILENVVLRVKRDSMNSKNSSLFQ